MLENAFANDTDYRTVKYHFLAAVHCSAQGRASDCAILGIGIPTRHLLWPPWVTKLDASFKFLTTTSWTSYSDLFFRLELGVRI